MQMIAASSINLPYTHHFINYFSGKPGLAASPLIFSCTFPNLRTILSGQMSISIYPDQNFLHPH